MDSDHGKIAVTPPGVATGTPAGKRCTSGEDVEVPLSPPFQQGKGDVLDDDQLKLIVRVFESLFNGVVR